MKLTSFIALVAIGAIGLVGIDRYKTHVAQDEATPIAAPESRAPQPEPVATPVEDRSWIKSRNSAGARAFGFGLRYPEQGKRDHSSVLAMLKRIEKTQSVWQISPGLYDGVGEYRRTM